MDTHWKLQRYHEKDYSGLVDFPVEIVGRDGSVRRYRFEEAVRLYHRRMGFAELRYRDPHLVDAEVEHCRARVEQLRRSFFHRYGWGTPDGAPAPDEELGGLAGEVAGFLCRVSGGRGRLDARIQRIPSGDSCCSIWYVVFSGRQDGLLLSVFPFDDEDSEARARFVTMLGQLWRPESGSPASEAEVLVASQEAADCGLVLSGAGPLALELAASAAQEILEEELTPWDHASSAIRRHAWREAFERCQTIVAEQPWHRSAHVAGAMVALALDRPEESEAAARLGQRYFPDDALLAMYLGHARLTRGLGRQAVADLEEAVRLDPGLTRARVLLGIALVLRGRPVSAWRSLVAHPADTGGDATDRAQVRAIAARAALAQGLAGFVIGTLGLHIALFGTRVAVCLTAIVAVSLGVGVLRRRMVQALAPYGIDDVRRGLRRIRRAEDTQGVFPV